MSTVISIGTAKTFPTKCVFFLRTLSLCWTRYSAAWNQANPQSAAWVPLDVGLVGRDDSLANENGYA